MKKILLIIPLILILTGCYNYRELNDLSIVSAINISKENKQYIINVQVVNPKKDTDTSSSNEPDFIVYKSKGKSLQEAFRLIVKESPKKIYGTQMHLLIIDEALAKEGINDILDFFARDPEVRKEFFVMISKEKNILEILTPLDNISSKNISDSLKSNSKYLGTTTLVTFNDLLANYQNDKTELTLPVIELKGNKKQGKTEENLETTTADASVVLSTIGIFKNNKLLGYLTEEQAIGYNLITGHITNTLITTNYKDGYIVNELIKVKSQTKAIPEKNEIKITIQGNAAISEVEHKIDLTKEKNIKKVQNDINDKIKKIITTTIQETNKQYNSDIYAFQDLFYKTNPSYYKTIKKNWDTNIMPQIKYEVSSNIKIVEQGNMLGGLKNE